MVDHPGTRLGRIEGNPFHEAVTEAARRARLRFIVNVVQDDQKQVVHVRAGEPETTFQELVALARALYEVPVPQSYDVAVAGAGFPKDANLYQASRAPSYLFFAPRPVVKPGGIFIVPAPCGEGAGEGVGEQRFLKAMQDAPDVQSILDDARRNGYPPGQQRAFVMAKVLEQNDVIVVGAEDPDLIRSAKFLAAPTMEAAFVMVREKLGDDLDVLVVPHALLTLPIVQE
jgi:nickel-dependent lactate racemase